MKLILYEACSDLERLLRLEPPQTLTPKCRIHNTVWGHNDTKIKWLGQKEKLVFDPHYILGTQFFVTMSSLNKIQNNKITKAEGKAQVLDPD